MPATPIPLASKDNSSGQLQGSLSNSTLAIVLQSGNGANFPQPYNGTATSLGSATLLNSTGISAAVGGSAVEGKLIWNKTDGSVARITTGGVATNAITTTRLLGGTTNVWNNADQWSIDPFVATFATLSTSSYGVVSIATYEEALIIGRSTDTLTVAASGRGYNGTVANTFNASDYVYLFSTSPIVERFKDFISVMAQQQDTDRTTLATANTNIANIQTGAYGYVVATGSANAFVAATPAFAAYAAGNTVIFKANFSISGATTINVNGLGAKSIKKLDGATALVTGDIISGQIVEIVYDGTNFQMVTPLGTAPSAGTAIVQSVRYVRTSADYTTTSASFVDIDTTNMTVDVVCTASTIVVMTLTGTSLNSGAATDSFDFIVGGTRVSGSTNGLVVTTHGTVSHMVTMVHTMIPGAGTKTIRPQWWTTAGTQTLRGTTAITPAVFTVVAYG